MKKGFSILWQGGKPEGSIGVNKGRIVKMTASGGRGQVKGVEFKFSGEGPCRLDVEVEGALVGLGANQTLVRVRTKENPFSFFLRDVKSSYPIYIPEYSVAVTEAEDKRDYLEISRDVEKSCGLSKLQEIEAAPEESYENASKFTRDLKCPTWLGISRDIRIFEVGFRGDHTEMWDWIAPRHHWKNLNVPEFGDARVRYNFMAGRGLGCAQDLTRRLEDGVLPILNASFTDEEVVYKMKFFVTNEKSPLDPEHVRGTHFLVADEHALGHMFTPGQQAKVEALHRQEMERDEETVIYVRVEAINTAKAPRYSWMKIPEPIPMRSYEKQEVQKPYYDGESGFGCFPSGRVYMVARLNGKPAPQEEMAVLLEPGEKAEYVFMIPHSPISRERAEALAKNSFNNRLEECVRFWRGKLAGAAEISLPERRIEEMIKAGLLHIDLVYYGLEPDGPVMPTIGVYPAIGSESSPGIQFLDSMGMSRLAERAIMYFIEKQHESGFMQNFGGYMLETGFVLWTIGEHYRCTRDVEWVKSIKDSILKACDYIVEWRERNKRDELIGRGYGMLDGKVADPEDPYHAYMLNSGAYIGLLRAAEALREIDPAAAERIAGEARELKEDIRSAFAKNMAESPVVPLKDGRWVPTAPPWAEYTGPVSLYAEGGSWYTHGNFFTRDSMCGPIYLLLQEVIDPREPMGDFLVRFLADLMYVRGTALSQPYYSVHPWANLKRGEVKAFLKEFYNGFSSLADRETYSFWEHYYHASPHKLHEEAWFLMRCRWMLWMEEGDSLSLLPGVPRAWLEDGKKISVKGVRTYFGTLSFSLDSAVSTGTVKAAVSIDAPASRLPKSIKVRIPHPGCLKASGTTMGEYRPDLEAVIIDNFRGSARFKVRF